MGGVYNKGVSLNQHERNIAMFGGSFNPPHNAHVALAARMRQEFSLERVLFVVASEPPHKSIAEGVDANTRFALTQAALQDIDGLEACDAELHRRGKSYTVDTLRELARRYPDARLWLIVGEDMLENLPLWRNPEEIFALATIAAASRPGALEDIRRTADALRARYGADVRVSAFGEEDVSSTAIRERVYEGKPVSRLVPPGTEDIIWELSLYQPAEIRLAQTKLKASLKPERYLHSVGTMRCAVELAERFGLDGKKARLAGLLHDCAKLSHERVLALAQRYGVEPDAYDCANPGLLHDRVGAHYAREEYGVTDAEILSAIASHTRLEKGMGAFSRMIYLADKIEPTRDYPGVAAIREAARTDMDRAALLCMENVLAHLRDKGCGVQPNIYEAMEELNQIIRSKEERH